MTVEDLQEAFFNFDEQKTGYISMQVLRDLVTNDGETMHDVRFPHQRALLTHTHAYQLHRSRISLQKLSSSLTDAETSSTSPSLNACSAAETNRPPDNDKPS